MADKEYQGIHDERIKFLNSGKANFYSPNSIQFKSFEEVVEMQLGCNKCFTLFDFQKNCFIKWHLVKELLGYDNNEFTIESINNSGAIKIIHEDDIQHKIRYDKIVYKILGTERNFAARMDSYCLSMKIYNKNGKIVPVKRSSYIFHASQHMPLTQLDEWEINNRYKSNHVFPELIVFIAAYFVITTSYSDGTKGVVEFGKFPEPERVRINYNNSNQNATEFVKREITPIEFKQVMEIVKNELNEKYKITNSNCVKLVDKVAKSISIKTPNRSSWKYPETYMKESFTSNQ